MPQTEVDTGRSGFSRRRMLGLGAGVALGAAGIATLSGCGTTGGASGSTNGRGGVLRVGLTSAGSSSTLDPDAGAGLLADTARYVNIYSRITEYDDNFVLQNRLAEELTPDPAANTWTLRIKPDLEFHNGKTMTADDVIFSLRRHADESSVNAAQLAAVDAAGLKKLDDRTVLIPTKTPFSTLPMALARYGGTVLPVDFDPRNPIGSGPFRMVSFTPGIESRLERFENYAFGPALVDELRIIEFADSAAKVNALLSGQVHAVNGISPSQLAAVRSSPIAEPLIAESGTWLPLVMNMSAPPFNDRRVRQAFRLMTDRQQMVDVAFAGEGSVGNDVFGRFDPSYIGGALPQREPDIDQAKSLLRQAGVRDLSLELTTAEIAPGVVTAATLFAEQAKSAGVSVKLRKMPDSDFFGSQWLSYKYCSAWWPAADYFYPATVTQGPGAPYNETHFSDPKWDALYGEAVATYDENRRNELFGECQRIDHDRGGYIVWGFSNFVDAVSAKTTGWPKGRFGFQLSNWQFSKVSLV